MTNEFEDAVSGGDVLPPKNRVRRAYIYYVILKDDGDGKHVIRKFTEQDGGRGAAKKYVNEVGAESVDEVVKISEIINLKVKTKVTVHF